MTFFFRRVFLLIALLSCFLSQATYAALCSDVFPIRTTSNATTPPQQLAYTFPEEESAYTDLHPTNTNNIGSGDQYYNGNEIMSDIIVPGGGTTRLYINGDLNLYSKGSNASDINTGGSAADLIIIINGNLDIDEKSKIKALIYVEGNVTLNGNPAIKGAITATGTAPEPKKNQIYDEEAAAAADFSTLCSTGAVTFDHFDINIPTSGSTCAPASVVITAIDTNGSTMTSYVDTLSLTTSSGHGGWASTGSNATVDSNTDDGAATYTYDVADAGVVTFLLTNTHADVMKVSATDISTSSAQTSSFITFSDNAFNFTTATNDTIAGRDHLFSLEYIKRDPGPVKGVCGVATDFTGNVNLKMSYGTSANHPAGANAPLISGTVLPSTQPAANNISLNFVAGVASFSLSTTDIGEYQLDVLDDSSGLAVNESGAPINISGSSALYSIRPFGIDVALPANPAASDATGGIFKTAGELFDIQARGLLYQAADDLNSDGIPDGHDDADPANNADLSDNNVAPSFGAEGETIALSSALVLPATGNNPGLSGATSITSFTNGGGSTSTASSFNEVGIIEVSASISDGTYLSSTGIIYGKSAYVGRFTPAYFTATSNAPALLDGWYDSDSDGINDWSCNFTYQGQEFAMDSSPRMTLAAINAVGVATQNYTGAFNKFTVASVSQKNIQFAVADQAASTASVPTVNNTVAIAMSDLGGGLIDFTISGLTDSQNGIFYNKAVQPNSGDEVFSADFSVRFFEELNNSSPSPALMVADPGDSTQPLTFASDLQDYFDDASYLNTDTNGDSTADSHQDLILRDADGVCYMIDSDADGIPDLCDEYTLTGINGTEIRYGRLTVENAYGSELLPLSVIYRAEYYDLITPTSPTSGFKVNDEDNSTVSGCAGTLLDVAAVALSDFQLSLDTGETSVGSVSGLSDGLGNLLLTAPGAGNQGMVRVNVAVPTWLEYDFDGDGAADQPSGIASFGVSGGDDLLFFQRESYR